ncbi:MAG: VOC family protein [Eggerthellaceae bacterium]|nr:VOC family protein [Eggerthellaceae bacterium]
MIEKILNKYAVNQLGYVVEDVEAAALTFVEALGAGPFVYMEPPAPAKTVFRGQEVANEIKVAYGSYGDLQIELIQPLTTDPTPYNEIGTGFNHFCCWVDDLDGAIKDFEDAGFEVAMLMESSGGLKVAYIDCLKAFGHYVEIHNPQPFLHDMCNGLRENWDGSDPVRPMRRG